MAHIKYWWLWRYSCYWFPLLLLLLYIANDDEWLWLQRWLMLEMMMIMMILSDIQFIHESCRCKSWLCSIHGFSCSKEKEKLETIMICNLQTTCNRTPRHIIRKRVRGWAGQSKNEDWICMMKRMWGDWNTSAEQQGVLRCNITDLKSGYRFGIEMQWCGCTCYDTATANSNSTMHSITREKISFPALAGLLVVGLDEANRREIFMFTYLSI